MVCFVIGYNETRTEYHFTHTVDLYFSYTYICVHSAHMWHMWCAALRATHTTHSVRLGSIDERESEGVNAFACFHLFSGFVAWISEAKRSDAYNVWVYESVWCCDCVAIAFTLFAFLFCRIHWRIESNFSNTSAFHSQRTNVISILDILQEQNNELSASKIIEFLSRMIMEATYSSRSCTYFDTIWSDLVESDAHTASIKQLPLKGSFEGPQLHTYFLLFD